MGSGAVSDGRPGAALPPDYPLAPEEVSSRLFRRGPCLFVGDDDGGWTLMHAGQDGSGGTVHIPRKDVWALAMAVLADAGAFSWEDHQDQVLLDVLLRWYGSGLPFSEVDPGLRAAYDDLLDRHADFLERLAALLPSRPCAESASASEP